MVTETGDGPPQRLTATEERVWEAFRRGEACDLRARDPRLNDPASDRAWPQARTVRAEVLALLLLDGPPPEPGRVASLKLFGAHIAGALNLAGGRVEPFMELRDCRFDSQLLLPEGSFRTLRLMRCRIPRVEAARVHVDGDLHMPGCVIPSGIRITDAHIGTDLLLNECVLGPGRNGQSVSADGLTVGQDVEAELMRSTGEISLRSARIGGRLSLRGSTLANRGGRYALNAARITVEHTLYLSSGWTSHGYVDGGTPPAGVQTQPFECDGALRLDDGRFGNAVIITRARFVLSGSQQFSLRRIQTPELRFSPQGPPTGRVVLAGARIGKLLDSRTSWPGHGQIDLTGFSYDSVSAHGTFSLADRIEWLANATPEYNPEPYERLAAALRAGGEDAEAREVLLARQRRRRESLPVAARMWGHLQDVTVGYGYRPARAALWMAVLWAVGAVVFALHGRPLPVDSQAFPQWNPALLALDLLLPVIDLGQGEAWRLAGAEQWAATVMMLLGWVLATTVATGASRLLRRG